MTLETLLPFYANGTLETDERAAVQAALAEDPDLRAELQALTAIRSTMQAEEVQSPGDFGLARLMRDVEADAAETSPQQTRNVVSITRLRVWQAAAMILLAVGLTQVGMQGPWTVSSGNGDLPSSETVQPLSASEPAAALRPASAPGFVLASGETDVDFSVTFDPASTEQEIRALLLATGVEIVKGPSALGLYGLGLIDSDDRENAEARLAEAGIVEHLDVTAQ